HLYQTVGYTFAALELLEAAWQGPAKNQRDRLLAAVRELTAPEKGIDTLVGTVRLDQYGEIANPKIAIIQPSIPSPEIDITNLPENIYTSAKGSGTDTNPKPEAKCTAADNLASCDVKTVPVCEEKWEQGKKIKTCVDKEVEKSCHYDCKK